MSLIPLLSLLFACNGPVLPDRAVAQLGAQMCALGHPNAQCGDGRNVGESHGPFTLDKTKERWIDVAVPYKRKGKDHTMVVRIHVKDFVPCSVSTNVISDDGPNPILLDNPLSSKLVGDAICNELGAK